MAERVLILGGTREAAALAAKLVAEGHDVTTSLAGRTKEPGPLAGAVRIGGFGGAAGLAAYLLEHRMERLIDATHPFATAISANARTAADRARVPLDVLTRPPWVRRPDDDWHEVATLAQAVETLPSNARVLLALGAQHIAPFAQREDVYFLIRMVDEPAEPLPFARYELLLGRPAASAAMEADMLRQHQITRIVCRNSGGPGAYAKIEAARIVRIPVVMVQRVGPEA